MKIPLTDPPNRSRKSDWDSVRLIGAVDIPHDYHTNHTTGGDQSVDHRKENKYNEAISKSPPDCNRTTNADKAKGGSPKGGSPKGGSPKYNKADTSYVNENEEDQMVSVVISVHLPKAIRVSQVYPK